MHWFDCKRVYHQAFSLSIWSCNCLYNIVLGCLSNQEGWYLPFLKNNWRIGWRNFLGWKLYWANTISVSKHCEGYSHKKSCYWNFRKIKKVFNWVQKPRVYRRTWLFTIEKGLRQKDNHSRKLLIWMENYECGLIWNWVSSFSLFNFALKKDNTILRLDEN